MVNTSGAGENMAAKPTRESSQPLTLRGVVEDWAADDPPKTGRERAALLLDHLAVQTAIVITVLVEVLLLLALLLIDLKVIQTPPSEKSGNEGSSPQKNATGSPVSEEAEVLPVDHAETAMHVLNILILSIFVVEMIVRLAVYSKAVFKDRWQIYDMVVVIVTFTLYISLTGASVRRTVTYSVGFIIILRLWRIERIYEGITQPIKRKAERVINSHRKARKLAEDQLQATHEALEKREREIAILRQLILSRQPSNFNSDSGSLSQLSTAGYEAEFSEHRKSNDLHTYDSSPQMPHGSVASISPASTISHHDSIDTVIEVTGVNLDLRRRQANSKGDFSMPPDDISSRFGDDALDRDLDSDNDTIRASSLRSSMSGGSTIKAMDCSDIIGDHTGSEMDFSDDVIKELTSKEFDKELEGRPPLDEKDSGKGDSFRNEKQDLIPGARSKDNYAYMNAGYSENELHDLTQEEISEIERIAQVPFMYGSTSRIYQDGIPMTDL